MKLLTLLVAFSVSVSLFSQAPDHRTCGMDSVHAHLMGVPEYAADWEERVNNVRQNEADFSNRGECDDPILIPVAAHFQNTGIPIDCAIEMTLDQVESLNADFGGYNTDISEWETLQPDIWPTISNQESCICFCVATLNHPDGFGLEDGDYAVTLDQTNGDNDAAWSGYLNFWVRTIGGGTLGYSPLGGTGNGDGVTVDPAYFGSVSCGGNTVNAPYDLGRTMTHEVGHYFLLDHPWGGGGCGSTDDVNDTPITDNAQFGCPAGQTIVTCDDPILWPTYMEYCDDACLFMFSQDQVERMETYANANLQNMMNNSVTVCQESACLDFEVDVAFSDETCAGADGSIVLTGSGGTEPYNYSVNAGVSLVPNGSFNGLTVNTYDIYVIDDFGCEFTDFVEIEQEEPQVTLENVEHEYCSDGTGLIEVSVDQATPFEYSIDGGMTWQDVPLFAGLSSAQYEVLVQNPGGCEGSVTTFIENQSDLDVAVEEIQQVNCTWFDNGIINIQAIGGDEPYSYTLDETVEAEVGYFDKLTPGYHSVYIEDAIGCTYNFDVLIDYDFSSLGEDCPCTVFIPNAITPDGDGDNERLDIVPSCPITDFHLQVYNRWGNLLFESFNPSEQWNGGYNGYYVEPDVYAYRLTFRWGNDESAVVDYSTVVGSVAVIR